MPYEEKDYVSGLLKVLSKKFFKIFVCQLYIQKVWKKVHTLKLKVFYF